MNKKIMLSGIQPTGALHIGNYLGALKNWENILNEYYGFFFIADYHAITIEYDAKEMQKRILDTAIEYLACGLDLEKCSIFVQSDVQPHTELAWIFNSIIPVAELERMTQYKDKSRKNAENINAALLTYPSLMAADILLYHPDIVPVGEDQEQHVELTRMIVRKFNNRYGEYFKEPETYHGKVLRILGLDGANKMSKSLNNHIPLRLGAEETEKLILQKAVTDPNRKLKTDKGNPEICNVYSYHKIFSSEEEKKEICNDCKNANIGCVQCKKMLAKNINKELSPIREKIEKFSNDKDYIYDVLNEGKKSALKVAQKTLFEVRDLMGLLDKRRFNNSN
ncbi:tryptophan--tRNA ligase [Brachyspira catarrhinii]|uniref:Tryptophan--tRNA ligase n=1 Tax=Brachyspira catarrhinii TaxID=2528966 RepID=A0ABY2TSB1_9SPIR|nr:tryptophan--tRNA ligase [Brachyspira catarrhinii]TKZ35674.1 tryptophan--tRNA ligase [Brachyspira catarrhinii]